MPVTTTLTDAPDAPQRSDPANFRADADTFVDWMANTFVDEIQAVIAEFNATFDNVWSATSTTSLTIGTGSKTFTISETEVAFAVGSTVRISDNADPGTNYMEGTVTAYTSSTGSMTVSVSDSEGSGTLSDWTISYIPSTGFFLAKTSNLSDLDDADDALDNLGGTATGKAVFTAASAAAARTAIGAIPSGGIIIWSGSSASIPTGWVLCNGANSTPDLRNRFVVGAGSTYSVDGTGGSADAINVAHTHTGSGTTNSTGDHTHTVPKVDSVGGTGLTVANQEGDTVATSSAGAHDHTVSITTDSAGASGTNANLPPYYALCYIMKT